MLQKYWQKWPSRFKNRDRTYIIPTWTGVAYAVFLFLFLLVAFFYDNNLIYAYVFILVSLGLSVMWLSNRVVEKTQIQVSAPHSIFLDESPLIRISFELIDDKTPKIFWIQPPTKTHPISVQVPSVNLPTKMTQEISFSLKDAGVTRGICKGQNLKVYSQSPMQFFEAWKVLKILEKTLIKPARIDHLQKVKNYFDQANDDDQQWIGFENWSPEHNLKDIHWKSFLKNRQLIMSLYERSGASKPIVLDWQSTDFLENFEERLEQMSFWIHHQQLLGHKFSVLLPGKHISSNEIETIWHELSLAQPEPWGHRI